MKNKKILLVIVAALIVLLVIGVLIIKKDKSFRLVEVNNTNGTVGLMRKDKPTDIYEGLHLVSNDLVTTGANSDITLLVDDDKHIQARENTSFRLAAEGTKEEGSVIIQLLYGENLYSIDNKLSENSEFKVVTPNALCAVRGTIFSVSYDKDKNETIVNVIEGKVWVSNKDNEEQVLEPDKIAIINDDGFTITDNGKTVDEDVESENEEVEEIEELVEEHPVPVNSNGENDTDIDSMLIGDTVYYGFFKGVPIEWEVFDINDNGILLLSKYVVDSHKYGTDKKDGWEESSLRAWMNSDLLEDMFTDSERYYIAESVIENPASDEFYDKYHPNKAGFSDKAADDTVDYLFVLDWKEIVDHYGVEKGDGGFPVMPGSEAVTLDGEKTAWWIRSNNQLEFFMMGVNDAGGMGYFRQTDPNGVRPAMYLSAEGNVSVDDDIRNRVGMDDVPTDQIIIDEGTYNTVPNNPENGHEIILKRKSGNEYSFEAHIWRIMSIEGTAYRNSDGTFDFECKNASGRLVPDDYGTFTMYVDSKDTDYLKDEYEDFGKVK